MDLKEQIKVCETYVSAYTEAPPDMKIGVSKNIGENTWPLHGLRYNIEGDTTGWYIWRGEYSSDPDFFEPMHVNHLNELCPTAIKYLGLAPGFRFLITDTYEDVWQDNSLIL